MKNKLTDLEYDWLTGWSGPPGAAYNQIYEFLYEDGLITKEGHHTPKALEALIEYEKEKCGQIKRKEKFYG